MKKSVLIAIQPYWVFLIIAKTMGWNVEQDKTVEVRKNFPRNKNWDKTVKIYCSKDRKSFGRIPKEYQPAMEKLLGKVVGEFVCDEITKFSFDEKYDNLTLVDMSWKSCLSKDEIADYANEQYIIFGWHISNLVVYDQPKELNRFKTPPCDKPESACENCKHLEVINTPNAYETNCYREDGVYLMSPPQSWCYIQGVA